MTCPRCGEELRADAKLCRRLTAEAFEHLAHFDWADVAERTAALYRGLIAADRAGAGERR